MRKKTSCEVLGLRDVSAASLSSVGAKASTLARLWGAGIPVPDFFVISSEAFALHLRDNKIPWPESMNVSTDLGRMAALRDAILQAPVPKAVGRPALEAYDSLCSLSGHDKAAVRSSGGEEDSTSTSFAGQFTSILGVEGAVGLLDAVKECWASYLSERSLRYRAGRGAPLPQLPTLGVIVQIQVFSHKAGVLFTEHPFEQDSQLSYIEANFGTGESVVGGLTTPDAITIARSNTEVIEARIATKRRMTSISPDSRGSNIMEVQDAQKSSPVLSGPETQRIVHTGLRIEELLGGPQDIEWAFDSHDLWILQSRPITSAA